MKKKFNISIVSLKKKCNDVSPFETFTGIKKGKNLM